MLTDQNRLRSVNDIMPMIGARFYTQLDAAQMRNDVIEEDLAKVKYLTVLSTLHCSLQSFFLLHWLCANGFSLFQGIFRIYLLATDHLTKYNILQGDHWVSNLCSYKQPCRIRSVGFLIQHPVASWMDRKL